MAELRETTCDIINSKVIPMYYKLQYLQEKRRQDTLAIQKQKREEEIQKRRHVENVLELQSVKNNSAVPNQEAYDLANSMMTSEWMLKVPEDIDSWISVLCPVGRRCCVISQSNKTLSVNKHGTFLNYFPSLFPYGSHVSNHRPSHRKRTVLDCVYNYKSKKYYILDIIEWMGVPYTNFDAEFRFYFIKSKLDEIPGINEISKENYYPFELAPRMVARDLYPYLFEETEFFPDNVQVDGINFYYPESMYTPGETPLVLWLKPFMVPDILQKPVNDHLGQLYKPPDYVNIFKYIENLNKKNKKTKKTKKKKNVHNCNNMDVDDLVEVDAANNIEDEMKMQN